MEDPAPHRGKDNDAGHVQRPRGKTELAHLGFTHRVEKELEIPRGSGEGREEEVTQTRHFQIRRNRSSTRSAATTFAARSGQAGMLSTHVRGEVLVTGLVFEIEHDAPDEVRREAADKENAEFRQTAPDGIGASRFCGLSDRIARRESEGKASAHDAAEGRDNDTLAEAKLRNRFRLLFRRHFFFLGQTGERRDRDAEQTDTDTRQRDLARRGRSNLRQRFRDRNGRDKGLEDRREQRADRGAVTERHTGAQRQAEIAHRQAVGQAAEAPEKAEEERPPKCARRLRGDDVNEILGQNAREEPRADQPREETANQPIGFPGPFFNAFVGNVETPGGQAAEPVKDNAKNWVGVHEDDA